MLNPTNVSHPSVSKKVLKACHESISQSVAHVHNRKGHAIMAVRRVTLDSGKKGFHITDKNGKNVIRALCHAHIHNNYKDAMATFISKNVFWDFEMARKGVKA